MSESRAVLSHNIHFYDCIVEKTNEIYDKERNSQTDINKEQTNIEENDINQGKTEPIEKHNPIDTSKLEKQDEEMPWIKK